LKLNDDTHKEKTRHKIDNHEINVEVLDEDVNDNKKQSNRIAVTNIGDSKVNVEKSEPKFFSHTGN
jgi:hypothetical protein